MKTKPRIAVSACLAVIHLALTGCRKENEHAEVPPARVENGRVIVEPGSPPAASVSIETAQPPAAVTLALNGRIVWDDNVTTRLFTPFAGRVTKIHVEAGQSIEAGAPLAAIASPDFGQAQADARRAETDFALAERTAARLRELSEHGAAARKDLQAAEAELERARLEKERTAKRLALYGAAADLDQAYILKSPIAGVVVEKNISPGAELRNDQMLANTPQLAAPLFVITDPSKLWIQIDVPERDYTRLDAGQTFVIKSASLPGLSVTGRVDMVSDSLDPNTHTVKARGSVVNDRRLLKAETFVTIPLETVLSGVPHSVRLFSHTQFGLSFIMITFDDKVTDAYVRQQVSERLQTADLPPAVQPQIAPLSTAIGEIYRYQGDGFTSRDLRTLEDWVVERNLRMVPGVADIVSIGGLIKTYEVNPDLARLRDYGLSLQQVYTALSRGNANVGGSKVEQGPQQYLIRGLGLLRSPDDIGNIVLTSRKGVPVHIRDVAGVNIGAVPREGVVGEGTNDDVVAGIVLMRKGENPSEVLKALKDKIAVLNRSVLPQGARIVPYYDRTWLIDTTLHTVFKNLAEGAMLVTFVLLLFLGNLRAAFIVALMIPLSLLATFIGLTWRGIPANLLSLGAMDFGIIVACAVIVVENIFRTLSEHDHSTDRNKVRDLVLNAAAEVGRPTFFSMLIIIVAHIPIFTLQRHEGRIFAPMAWTVTSALVGSLLFSLTLVPLLCFYFLRKGLPEKENLLVRTCARLYRPALVAALSHRRLVTAGAVAAMGASLSLVPLLGSEFLPELNEGTIWINLTLPPGISVSETTRG